MKKLNLVHFLLILAPCMGNASELADTRITRLMSDRNYEGLTFIQVERNPIRDGGHCHGNQTWDYVLRNNDDVGKQIMSELLLAYAAGKTIKLKGTDSCPAGETEELRRIELY